jgi:hypothetical protein
MKLAQQAKGEEENLRRKGRVVGASNGEHARSELEIIYIESRGLRTFAAGLFSSRAEVSWGQCQDTLDSESEIWKSFLMPEYYTADGGKAVLALEIAQRRP